MHKKDMSEQQCVAECCEVEEIHPHLLQEALAKMPSPEELNDLAELFKVQPIWLFFILCAWQYGQQW